MNYFGLDLGRRNMTLTEFAGNTKQSWGQVPLAKQLEQKTD